ncbi:MAG: uracil-xanthine permease family protein [Acutalibacteraceae bacterium]
MSKKKVDFSNGIYDARELGAPKMLLLGLQHMFAMFGATVLVPALTGLSVSATLLFAGLGTLLFHLLTKGKVPAFLGSSFAFIGGYAAITQIGTDEAGNAIHDYSLLPYACVGVACAGLLYLVLAGLIKIFGAKKVMRFFPPIVTGPIIIAIGLTLSSSAISNCSANWLVAVVAIAIVIVCNIWGKGMVKIIPIMLGVLGSSLVAVILHLTGVMQTLDPGKIQALKDAAWIGLPFKMENTVFGLFSGGVDTSFLVTAIITIMPIALATMIEHIGDISAISSTCNRNYIADPGLHRTLLGDGLATILASLFGAPANTTYGENTGVLSLSKVYDPRVIRIAAVFAALVSFSPKFSALVSLMPTATIGGVSLVLYGMISAVGVRNVVENKVDFGKSRNVIIAALILVLSIGINYAGAIQIPVGSITISLSGLAVGALVGIILNAVLPGKDYEFGADEKGDQSVNFKV